MKLEIVILGITAFVIYNTYHDGYYSRIFTKNKKYIQMGGWALLGISLYLMAKRNPANCKNMLLHANNVVKYMPVDRSSIDMLSPILDFTTNDSSNFMKDYQNNNMEINNQYEKKILQSGGNNGTKKTKRSVSETKKKYVAAQQSWKCNTCSQQLTHTFQVDHKIDLQFGGSNDVSNLAALCNNCHANKTSMNNL